MPKVSIIIPVLNGSKYIDSIMDYLDQQTFRDFEIIFVIDSRSVDGSLSKARSYASEDIHIVLEDQGPLGISRNTGLNASKGEFIWFLDCDDRPLPAFLEKLMDIQDKYSADIVGCNFIYSSNPNQNFDYSDRYQFKVKVMNSSEAIKARSEEKMPVSTWSKIFRKSLLTDNGIVFNGEYCEDINHTYKAFAKAEVVCYYDEPLYVYYQHSSSFCNNPKNHDKRGYSEIEAYRKISEERKNLPSTELDKRIALVTFRSSGHMTYKSFKAYAKSPECRSMLKKHCRWVPEALWYRMSPTTYYYAEQLYFKHCFYREGRLFSVPEKKHDTPEPKSNKLPNVEEKLPITIGVCAYNEEKNIERTLRSVFRQKCSICEIKDVLVVSSGSTDGTNEIVNSLSKEFPQIRLIPQSKREGKNSAINLLFENKSTEIMVFLNADNVFENSYSLDRLIEPLFDENVGMVGGHPLPTNKNDCSSGYTVQLMWKMHHYVALQRPKTGELIAFRDIGTRLPTNMQSDEDILRMKLEERGYKTVYAPEAEILNRGPENARDYIKQRTRVNIGENYLVRMFDYNLPTHDYRLLVGAFINSVRELGFHPLRMVSSLFLELYPRLKARVYVMADKGDMCVWDQVSSTKKL